MKFLSLFFALLSISTDFYALDLATKKAYVEKSARIRNGEDTQTTPLIQEGEISTHVNDIVNVMTGKCAGRDIDYVSTGPVPLLFERYHDDTAHAHYGGWHILHDHHAVVVGKRPSTVCATDSTGDEFYYFRHGYTPMNTPLPIHKHNFDKGIVNTATGEIGGCTNKKNQYAAIVSLQEFYLRECDGTKRIYRSETPFPINLDESEIHPYMLSEIVKPSGHRILIERRTRSDNVKEITFKATNPRGDKVFSTFTLNHKERQRKQPPFLELITHEGKKITYNQICYKKDADTIGGTVGRDGCDLTYEYHTKRACLARKVLPNKAALETYYYCHKNELPSVPATPPPDEGYSAMPAGQIGNYVFVQRAPVGEDATPIVTHRFCYYKLKNKNRPEAGYTDVFDAYNNKTRYYFNKRRRVFAIDKYLGNNKLYISENMVWDENRKSVNLTQLNCRFWKNEAGEIINARTFEYDPAGNVVKERLYGNFSGTNFISHEDACNLELFKMSSECYTKTCTYSDDDFHLKLSESSKEGVITYYSYLQGTNLPKSTLISINGKISERCFYEYDEDNLLVSKIIDDGSSEEPNNLTDVQERRVSRIYPKQSCPGLGLPEITEELYYDTQLGREVLLSRKINSYHSSGKIAKQSICDGNGTVRYTLSIDYDDQGRIHSESDPLGNMTTYSYDACGNKIREELSNGVCREFTYDLSNRLILTRELHPDGTELSTKCSYNYLSQKIAEEDTFGSVTTFEYDCFGNLLKVISPEDGSSQSACLIKKYDGFGRVIEETDPRGFTTKVSLNVEGKPFRISHPDGTSELFEYNLSGSLKSETLKNGTKVLYEYDEKEREIRQSVYDSSDNLLKTTTKTYNSYRLISETDAAGITTHYSYDGAGRVIKTSRAGSVTTFDYDCYNEIFTKTEWLNENEYISHKTIRNPLGQTIEEQVSSSQGLQSKIQYSYDAYGNKSETITFSHEPQVEQILYNTLNEPIQIVDPAGSISHIYYDRNHINTFGHKVLQVTTLSPLHISTLITYNRLGKIASVEVKNESGECISYKELGYDLSGNLSSLVADIYEGVEKKSSFETRTFFGPMNRKEREVIALNTDQEQTTYLEYDNMGMLSTKTDAASTSLHHEYDALGRLVRIFSDQSASVAPIDYVYTYNAHDLPTTIEDKIQATRTLRVYNSQGQLEEETLSHGYTLKYTYDLVNRCTGIILPDGSSMTSAYAGAFLKTISRLDPLQNLFYTHEYLERDLSGRILTMQTPAGKINFSWSPLGKLSSIESQFFKNSVDLFDPNGNMLQTTCMYHESVVHTHYTYDALNQIIEEKMLEGTLKTLHSYQFDSVNNRIKENENECTHNALNQLIKVGDKKYTYDLSGNRTESSEGTLFYDALNRLVKFTNNAGEEYHYSYDSFNRRMTKNDECYLYVGNNEIGMLDSSGSIKELRILGEGLGAEIGAAIAFELDDTVYIPIHNLQGSLALLLDATTHQPLESYRYTAFGKLTIFNASGNQTQESAFSIPWLFSSKRRDPESGFIYFGRRYYDANCGTWLTTDPKGFGDGVHLYAYVQNNPLSSIDLYGLARGDLSRHHPRSGHTGNKAYTNSEKTEHSFSIKEWGNNIGKCIDFLRSTTGKFINFVGHELPIPYVRLGVKALGNYISHGSFLPEDGSPLHVHSRIDIIGQYKEGAPFLVSTNGQSTSFKESRTFTDKLSRAFGGILAYQIYNSTHGLILDSLESFANLCGIPTRAEAVTVYAMKTIAQYALQYNVPVIQFAHSQAGLLISAGLDHLTPNERTCMHVHTFGSAHMISNNQAASVVNHVNSFDPIPWIADLPGMVKGHFGNGIHLHVLNSWIPGDHSILGASYQNIWQTYGANFTKNSN